MADDLREQGMATRREVLGDAHVDRSMNEANAFTRDFQEHITRYAWGAVWSRPGLDRRTRSCITVAMLAAQGNEDELVLHLRAALRNGVTVDELKEVLLQVAVYAGVPRANRAFSIARSVLEAGAATPPAPDDPS
jgi:4-carboxymuconolactone decarboxylase